MSLWKLGRRQGACHMCEHGFAEGESHYSFLFVEQGQLGRRDVCTGCWQGYEPDRDQPWWRARRREKKAGGVQVDLGLLEQLFLLSKDSGESRLLELRYLIALLLLRKRRLLLGRVRSEEGVEWLLLRRPRRQEELPVRVYEFAPEQLDGLRQDLERLLEMGSLDAVGSAEGALEVPEGAEAERAGSDPAEPEAGAGQPGPRGEAVAAGSVDPGAPGPKP